MSNMQLDTLRRIVQEINASTSLHESLDIMVNHVAEAMHVDVCSIYLLDERNQRYLLMASKGLNPDSVGHVSLHTSEGLVGLVGQREEIVNLDNAPKHERFMYLPETGEEIYNSFLGVPVMYRRKVMGVLVVQNKESQDFSEAAESFLVTLCAQLSGVIAHAHAVGNIDVFRKPSNLPAYKTFQGVPGSGGIALGRAVILYPPADLAAVPDREADDISEELELLDRALTSVRDEIKSLDDKMQDALMAEERALFSVFLRMLDENALPAEIKEQIRDGNWAQGAVRIVIDNHIDLFEQMEDDYLRERAADLKDLGRRILAYLQEADSSHRELTDESILIGEEISTAALVELPVDKIAAIVTTEGAMNSHMVIVARALGIPTVVGVTELPINTLPGDLEEKMAPYVRYVGDLLMKLHDLRPANRIFADSEGGNFRFNPKRFEILPIAFIRGMNLENAVVIIDEMQNLSRAETRALLTRMGENVKCICLGDTRQVDNPYLNESNNGLNWTVKMLKGLPGYGHIVLKGERSRGPITDMVIKTGL